MPARKPKALITRHQTKAEDQARADAESALTPKSDLPINSPSKLSGHKTAQKVWRRLMQTYDELDGVIVSKLDFDLMVDYCLMMEQALELDQLRESAMESMDILKKVREEQVKTGDIMGALLTSKQIAPAMELIVKIDSRADRKRAELNKMRTYLYLTPRARAGVSPNKKEEDQQEMDPMAMLLGEVTDYVNGENGDQDK